MQTIKTFLERSPRSLHTVQNNQTVWEALDIMATNNIGALPVLSGESMVGIFSERDYARRVELKGNQHIKFGYKFIAPKLYLNDLLSVKVLRIREYSNQKKSFPLCLSLYFRGAGRKFKASQNVTSFGPTRL